MKRLILGLVVGILFGLAVSAIADIVLIRPADVPVPDIKLISPNGIVWQLCVDNSGIVYTDSIGYYQR